MGPTASFSAAPRSGDAPLDVDFTNLSIPGSSEITSTIWDFGDGAVSTLRNAAHSYSAPGIYTVSLTVNTADGSDTETLLDYITVLNAGQTPPNAAFTGTPTTGPPGTAVQFSDASVPGSSLITSWSWTFGDGGTSTLQNPSHVYATDGSFAVSLSVTTTVGTDTETKPAYIVIVPVAPIAAFSANPTGGFGPLTVTFTDESVAGTRPIASWAWNFGDGGTATLQNPTHVYDSTGTYTVSLTVSNTAGSDIETKPNLIVVSQAPVPPTAEFSGTPRSGVVPLPILFTDLSTAGTSPITTRSWDFGDGSTSTATNPAHIYTTPGSYTVVLSVSTAAGTDTESKASYIVASAQPTAPTADFSAFPLAGFVPLGVSFTDQSLTGGSPITSWAWNFGDGGTSTLQNPSHTYTTPGTYTVSLATTNSVGSDDTTKVNLITASVVPVAPTAAFSGTPTTGNAPLAVSFTDLSNAGTSPITARLWDFGDGTTSTAANPSHTYTGPGGYTVALSISTAVGDDTENKASYIVVSPALLPPTASFSAFPTAGFLPLAVAFTDQSANGGSPITSWAWSFGDGGTSTLQSPSHTYNAAGTYTVSLAVTNAVGSDTDTIPNLITASVVPVPPTAQFSGTPTSGEAPLAVSFTDLSTAGTSPITTRLWDFGDQTTSTEVNPSHIYTNPGSYTVVLSVSTAAGDDTENKAAYIVVSPTLLPPTAAFSAAPAAGFVPLAVTFTDQSVNGGSPITSWAWSFGDGGTSTLQSPSHTYSAAGTYTVSLAVTNAVGSDTDTIPNLITASVVPVPPTADFSGTPTSGDAPLAVTFTDLSTPGTSPITTRLWDFGDQTTSTEVSPSHTYTNPGSYTVVLSVSTAAGDDTENKAAYIVVSAPLLPPTAAFSAAPTAGFVPLAVAFTDQSVNGGSPITSWAWNFGDGGTSTLQSPSHTYSAAGTYTVSLAVTNAVGSDTDTIPNLITASVVPVPPTADFSGTPTSGNAPLAVTFTDLSTAGTSPITARLWDFGDQTTSTEVSPSHTYTNPGTYTVVLSVSTAAGDDTENKPSYVVVSPAPTAPNVGISAVPTGGVAPLVVTFTDQSVNGGSPITSWAWGFGDGGTSTAQNPSHTYTSVGAYTVSLTVTNIVGSDTDSIPGFITVSPVAPTASFSASPTSGSAPLAVNFTDQSANGGAAITSWAWSFGDGGASTEQNPSHTYTTVGTYTVSLTVTNVAGSDTDSIPGLVTVSPSAPTASFTALPTVGFVPLAVTFTDQSVNGGSPITSWAWSFGDGGTSTLQSPSHTYGAAGTYTVSLAVTNAVGSDTDTIPNLITASVVPVPPTAQFSGTPTSGNAPLAVTFTDLSTAGTSPITTRLWDFGDGTTSTATNPSHTYAGPGGYTVALSISTADGDDTENKPSYIVVSPALLPPTAAFSAVPTAGFVPLAVAFTDLSTDGGTAITSRAWNFGDGGTSTEQNPSHTYNAVGTYTVSLAVTNAVGSDTDTIPNLITASVVPVPPTADFSGTPTSGNAPLAVTFTDLSTAGTSPITSRLWDFGDQTTSTETNPSHTYTNPGAYTVVLSVSTADGDDTENKASYIVVSPALLPPTAAFSAVPTAGFVPLAVAFTDQSTDGGTAITSWAWSFGDGGTSTLQSPSHTYSTAGTYTVSLAVTNAVGSDTDTIPNLITASVVPVPPTADFSGTPTSGNAPLAVTFTDLSTPGTSPITARLWDFGDQTTSTETNPSHTYTNPGGYTVVLSVSTAAGDDTENKAAYIVVSPTLLPPTAAFSAVPTVGFVPLAVAFTDQSTDGGTAITSWAWSFGDGGTSTLQSPSHTYNAAGTYTVSLAVTNAVGSDTDTIPNLITASVVPVPPVAAFTGTPTSGYAPLAVTYTDLSTAGTSPITARLWDFGDQTTSTEVSPSHTYAGPGIYTVVLSVSTADGADTESKTDYITVTVPPTADFSGTPTSGDAPLAVTFTDFSTAGTSPISARSWDFGDGGTSTATNPSHTYTTPGTYTVALTVTTADGVDTESKANYIQALTVPPTADFSGTPASGDAPLAVTFTDLSTAGTAPITAHLWAFGDGGTSTATNPSHTYATPGTYTVALTVTTADGVDTESKANYIEALAVPPTADFIGTPASGDAPLAVTFTDLSTAGTAPITARSWDFGDGGASTATNPSHTYATPGTYTVALTVTTADGVDTESKTNYIQALAVPPTADFSGTPASGDAPLAVTFTDLSTAGTAPITAWSWDFGDGGASTATNPSHTYTIAGTYTVALTVTTADGVDTESKTNYIQASAVPPTADFSGTPASGDAPLAVTFTDLSAAGSAAITARSWDFGDGGTSAATNPSHTYATPGTYTVALTVTTADGVDTETKANYIQASAVPPTADFSGTPASGDAPLAVTFTDLSTAGTAPITAHLWAFGDGGTSTATNPSHTYATPGTYTVALTVTTADGVDTESKTDYIEALAVPPTADFSGTPASGDAPLAVTFTDLSTAGTAPITARLWAFGDGGTSTATNPSHTFATPGSYTVALTVTTADGVDTESKANYIQALTVPPTADFSGTPASGDAPLAVTFTDLSTSGTAPITARLWAFGDGGTSTATNPSHTYTTPGTYTVALTVTTADGVDTESKANYIQALTVPPTADFSGTPASGDAPLAVTFTDLSTAGTSPITAHLWAFR